MMHLMMLCAWMVLLLLLLLAHEGLAGMPHRIVGRLSGLLIMVTSWCLSLETCHWPHIWRLLLLLWNSRWVVGLIISARENTVPYWITILCPVTWLLELTLNWCLIGLPWHIVIRLTVRYVGINLWICSNLCPSPCSWEALNKCPHSILACHLQTRVIRCRCGEH
jgi:hypothetical protein